MYDSAMPKEPQTPEQIKALIKADAEQALYAYVYGLSNTSNKACENSPLVAQHNMARLNRLHNIVGVKEASRMIDAWFKKEDKKTQKQP